MAVALQTITKAIGRVPRKAWRLASIFFLVSVPTGDTPKPEQETPNHSLTKAWQDANKLCLHGCPTGAPAANRIVDHKFFVLSNNGTTKFADWVAYVVTRDTICKSQPDRNWRLDNDLPKTDTLAARDYDGVAELGYDRGHQAPLASLCGMSQSAEVNELSNITPQKKDLNEGAWKRLESAERKLADKKGLKVHSVTGPLYERDMPKLPNARLSHTVPSGYWKVVMVERGGKVEAAAFIMNQELKLTAAFCDYAVTLTQVETRSRLKLLPNLPKAEPASANLLKDMGCK